LICSDTTAPPHSASFLDYSPGDCHSA
jgi:hypothetical protein